MKKLIASLSVAVSLLFASPAFAYTELYGDTINKFKLTTHEPTSLSLQNPDQDLIYVGLTVHTIKAKVDKTKLEKKAKYSADEIDLLARLVRAEAEDEPYQGKIAVACVVLNRVESPAFPNTIKKVIYQKRQFQPVSNGQINKAADEDSIKAVHEALNEKRQKAAGSLFFYNPAIATSRWLDTRSTTLVIGNHVFKK